MYFIYEILDKTHFGRLVNAIKWNFTGFNSDRTQQFSATWCYNMTFNNLFFSRTLSIFLQGANMMQISFKFYYSVLKASLLWECIIYTHIFEYLQRTGFFYKMFHQMCCNLVKGFCCYTTSQQGPNKTSSSEGKYPSLSVVFKLIKRKRYLH